MSDKLYVEVGMYKGFVYYETVDINVLYAPIDKFGEIEPLTRTQKSIDDLMDSYEPTLSVWVEYNEDLSIFKKNIEEAITLMEII